MPNQQQQYRDSNHLLEPRYHGAGAYQRSNLYPGVYYPGIYYPYPPYKTASQNVFSEDTIQRQLGNSNPESEPQPQPQPTQQQQPVNLYKGAEICNHGPGECRAFYGLDENGKFKNDVYADFYGIDPLNPSNLFPHVPKQKQERSQTVKPENAHPKAEADLGPVTMGYVEGYHDPQLKVMTPDWWKLVKGRAPEQYILLTTAWVRRVAQEAEERARDDYGGVLIVGGEAQKLQDEIDDPTTNPLVNDQHRSFAQTVLAPAHAEEEAWTPERYFETPHSSPLQPFPEQYFPYPVFPWEEHCHVQQNEEVGSREPRGRDDWECAFCGLECFCWTVVGAKDEGLWW